MTTITLLLITLIGALLGIMIFFAATAAPTAFRHLPTEHSGTYIRSIFPVYYLWGIVLASVISALSWPVDSTVFILAIIITALFLFSRLVLMPIINVARDARNAGDEAGRKRFGKLHRISVLINLSQMIMLITSLVILSRT